MRSRSPLALLLAAALAVAAACSGPARAGEGAPAAPPFRRIALSDRFLCEGANAGDLDRNGTLDIVAGPYWYEGPTFATRRALAEPREFDPLGYSDKFFAWVHDVSGDGWDDVVVVGFPGKEAAWLENPRGAEGHWPRHMALTSLDNESPWFVDVTGDGRPELVGQVGGAFGYAEWDPDAPTQPWTFRAISPRGERGAFTHGLGIGDVNGDGRPDLIEAKGWWEQPAGGAGASLWTFHPAAFGAGGAQMFALDVDGDGDQDIVTSLAAHGRGLAWFEQRAGGTFVERPIAGATFGEIHALDLADVNGDGLLDIVTGKRWWSHGPKGDVDGGPAVLYWFELVRRGGGAEFIPHRIDDASGVGTQVVARDLDGDRRTDVLVANKRGTFVFLQESRPPHPNLGFETGTLAGWTTEGTAFAGQPIRGDTIAARRRDMKSAHRGEWWIGTYEVAGDGPQGTLTSAPFRVTERWASFLVGGGSHARTCVEIGRADTKETIFRISGDDSEELKPVVVDLEAHLGREIFIRLVDAESGHWGHVNFDAFAFSKSRPAFPNERRPDDVPPPDVVEHAGLAPADAARAMTARPGFRVTLAAAEPEIHQPVAFTFDDRGRIWLVEAHTYPVRAPEGEGRDRIVILEDRDGDGRCETRAVFADGLNLVSGIELGFGGVFVGAAPYLLFLPDRNRDDRPDGPPEILLDGWGYQDTHETLNSFAWGPDGWLYGCHGVFTCSRVGRPGTPEAERVPLDAGVWRYHPLTRAFEVFAEGTSNPWGIDFDDQGRAFITACVIPHLYHVVQGGRYVRQAGRHANAGAHVYEDIATCADHVHYGGSRGPHAGNGRSSEQGGGHAHCGAMVYLGGAWPPEYRGAIFMGNIHGNRINVDIPAPRGSTVVARHGPDFLLANDRWFRMITVKYGPDGAAWFSDWYDRTPCHTTDPTLPDRRNGRLYRVTHESAPRPPAAIDVATWSDERLVEAQLDPNDWIVRHARRVLMERMQAESAEAGAGPTGASPRSDGERRLEGVRARLAALARAHPDGTRRLRALWALHAAGGAVEEFLGSADEHVRAWAIQLLLEKKDAPARIVERLAALAREDRSAVVRLHLAAALQRLPLEARFSLVEGLVARPEDDPAQGLMIWYGAEPLAAADARRFLAIAARARVSKLFGFAVRRVAALGTPEARAALVALLDGAEDARAREVLANLAAALRGQRRVPLPEGWETAAARLAASADPDVRFEVAALSVKFGFRGAAALGALAAVAADAGAPAERRMFAVAALAETKDPSAPPVLRALLRDGDGAVRRAALQALAGFDDERTPPAILDAYASFPPDERKAALATLAGRASFARALVAALGSGRLPARELTADLVRQLRALGDPELDRALARTWGAVRATPEDRRAEIARLRALVAAPDPRPPDPSAGRAIAARTCLQCHTLFGRGGTVGPDITGSNRADLDYLLENIVDPDALIPAPYRTTIATTRDGQVAVGILAAETAAALTLATPTGPLTLAREDVAEVAVGETSMMPQGLLAGLADADVRDLIAYLRAPAQVPLRADPSNAALFFDGKTLAFWEGDPLLWRVEGGEIAGTSPGRAREAVLASELLLDDFRLALEVKRTSGEGEIAIEYGSGAPIDIAPLPPGEWTPIEVVAAGGRVKARAGDRTLADIEDPRPGRRGAIALRLRSTGDGPLEARFRRLALKPS